MTDAEIAKLAEGLSKAQRQIFHENRRDDFCWFRDERSVVAFRRRGLVDSHRRGSIWEWSETGLRVRQHLLSQKETSDE